MISLRTMYDNKQSYLCEIYHKHEVTKKIGREDVLCERIRKSITEHVKTFTINSV